MRVVRCLFFFFFLEIYWACCGTRRRPLLDCQAVAIGDGTVNGDGWEMFGVPHPIGITIQFDLPPPPPL